MAAQRSPHIRGPSAKRNNFERGVDVVDVPTVVDTWPSIIPIALKEVEAVEIFLGRLIDQLLSED